MTGYNIIEQNWNFAQWKPTTTRSHYNTIVTAATVRATGHEKIIKKYHLGYKIVKRASRCIK